jgi:hypothetical protein
MVYGVIMYLALFGLSNDQFDIVLGKGFGY